jgi:hypothetical protein
MWLGYEHADHANITGEGLQSLKDDPSVQAAQGRIVDKITGKSEYGEQDFSLKDISDKFTANGSTGKWYQAAWEGNQAFFMVHTGSLSATNIRVSADGTISTTWVVTDKFDYIPNAEKGFWYNFFAVPTYFFYNIVGDAEEQYPTNAYWDETIPPEEE